MNRLIFFSLLSVFFLFQANPMNAQTEAPNITAEQKANFKGKLEAFAQELDLTEEQQSSFQKIHQSYFAELRNLKVSDMSKFSKYQKYKSIQNDKQKSVKGLLSKGQYKQYKKGWDELEKQLKALSNA